ncbi:DNA-binding FadR family transcriptional regulator [Sphingopyxis panaciterrae]|uniref:FadR/GntR family transcriptional regulator n=1 Tax=Sphingopyxis panaciterrae TaxID=363841 RepID=UPI00141E5E38|nr:FCD domain-containing protein [Sphingopyxis panaciterrae]NIJ36752.1 DNA-binding FadR family transcriptional regulator [Sphingopyxis panaciterrae]
MEKANARIRVPKTSELVADQIRAQIVRGELNEGDSLPPEGTLMATLGISRPTLREAFRILEAENLISVVRGSRSGARVHRPSTELVSRYAGYVLEAQGTTIADLYTARLAIEPTVVRWLATSKGQTPGFAQLKQVLADLENMLKTEGYAEFVDNVSIFHQTLVEATGNKTLSFMNRMLLDLGRHHQNDYQRRHPRTTEDKYKSLRAGYKSFEKLVTMIEDGDVEGAVAHWRLHLRNANDTWGARGEAERIVDSLHG